MSGLLFIWFAALASCPVLCWTDARFSAVRQLSAKQYQEDYNGLVHGGERDSTDLKSQSRSSRPLFSWDFVPPAPVSVQTLTPHTAWSLTGGSDHSLLTVPKTSERMKRKKNRNKKKDSAPTRSDHKFSNQSQLAESDKSILNLEERGNGDRMQGSFPITNERKRRNKHRKDRTGKRKPKSERKKGDRNKKRKDRKLRRKGRKQKEHDLINNSLPTLTNDYFHRHETSKKLDVSQSLQSESLPQNRITHNGNLLSTTENHITLDTRQPEVKESNKVAHKGDELKLSTKPNSFEINGATDNILLPILHPSIIGSSAYSTREQINAKRQGNDIERNSSSIIVANDKLLSNTFNSISNGTIGEEISNNSLPTDPYIKLVHNESIKHNTLVALSSNKNITLETYNELFHKESYLSLGKENNSNLSDAYQHKGFGVLLESSKDVIEGNFTGDLSCLTGTFLPAPTIPDSAIKYIRTQTMTSPQSNLYLIAEYECEPHHHLKEPSSYQLICSHHQWLGELPVCVPDKEVPIQRKECADGRGGCDHICQIISGNTACSCYKGFRLVGSICEDINECEFAKGGCENECRNTPGSHQCLCPLGLRVADNGISCVDINECLLRNGHGPCQDSCHNLWGSYECSCLGIPGTRLAADNHTCQDVDECTDGTAGCSHTCLNTLGSAFCLCPVGFMLGDDWKTCQDIDECSYEELETEHCELGCVNTVGSYHCLELDDDSNALQHTATELPITCPLGMRQKTDGSCEDIDECEEKTSGCAQGCLNIKGSFQCYCGLGFSLSADNKTCVDGAEEAVCPPLDSPPHGYLECARHLVRKKKSKYPWMKRARVVNHAGSICQLKCPHGYILEGEYRKTCGQDRQWTGPENGTCISLPAPSIRCPRNMTVPLKSGRTIAYIVISQPTTNVNWFRYVESVPIWGKLLETNLPLGHWEVKFTAKHPASHLTASCILTINVTPENQ